MKQTKLNSMSAIRLKCLDCSGGGWREVEACTVEKCSLHPFRFGKWPKDKSELSGSWACGDGKL